MYELSQQYCFYATHQVHDLPVAHPCASVHRHRWTVEVVLTAARPLPTDGPFELVGLEPLRLHITAKFNNAHLNDILLGPPTPARAARHIAIWCQQNLVGQVAGTLTSVVIAMDAHSRARYTVPRSISG
jgi:6-pyruvoyl-tetrahydropterin synthase